MSYQPAAAAPPYPVRQTGPRNGVGAGAFVVAVAALVFSWSVIGGVVGGIIAVVLGVSGRRRARRGEADNGPVATAGMALGALAVVVGIAAVPVWSGFLGDAGVGDYLGCMEKAIGESGTSPDPAAQQKCENEFRDRIEHISGLGTARG
ncbi:MULTISPECIES: hypothetical protein [Mycobacteriaceae]|uniref:DUF4190 domain-containing protein n=1 Tax=Mycolicibacterium neoaurum VKM Ac-1815D TaxID=700508 RepID=V5XCV0_MYCNE|nr:MULTISPECIES: hypothetical protein [Mycobacteriaceae]AMO06635.1 hypothetical protein MyAD_17270 [Mycolicibacterium neoaurum]